MTPEQARLIRRQLRLTQAQLATVLGLAAENGDRTVRAWEDGTKRVTGPAAVALAYMSQGALDDVMRQIVPEYVQAEGLGDDDQPELVIRLWTPRFVAAVVSAEVEFDGPQAWIEPDVEKLCLVMWIDPPGLSKRDPTELLAEAASRFQEYSLDALE